MGHVTKQKGEDITGAVLYIAMADGTSRMITMRDIAPGAGFLMRSGGKCVFACRSLDVHLEELDELLDVYLENKND